jgi:hypothetical protein
MTTPVVNRGDQQSFFTTQNINPDQADLISSQIDPTQPQVDGLTPVTDPIIPDRVVVDRLTHMDPTLYDLRDSSHLMRLMKALLGAAGAGGLRKQMTMRRLSSSMSGTHFLDLDGFWGALFAIGRTSPESMPTNPDGTSFNPMTQVGDHDTWDDVASRDGMYRSRITQFARAVNQGASYYGILAAAEALLSVECDIIESWTYADLIPPGTLASAIGGNTWFVVRSQYPTYGDANGLSWGTLEGGVQLPGQAPLSNRGEVIIRPKRVISQEEKRQVAHALDKIRPAGTLITVFVSGDEIQQGVPVRSVWSDSEAWDVVSVVTEHPGLINPSDDIYPDQSSYQGARPAFSSYSGEQFSYNGRISSVRSYTMENEILVNANPDYETVTYLDGQTHSYVPTEGVMSAHQAAATRAASEGVLTVYPYSPARAS